MGRTVQTCIYHRPFGLGRRTHTTDAKWIINGTCVRCNWIRCVRIGIHTQTHRIHLIALQKNILRLCNYRVTSMLRSAFCVNGRFIAIFLWEVSKVYVKPWNPNRDQFLDYSKFDLLSIQSICVTFHSLWNVELTESGATVAHLSSTPMRKSVPIIRCKWKQTSGVRARQPQTAFRHILTHTFARPQCVRTCLHRSMRVYLCVSICKCAHSTICTHTMH